MSSSRELFLGTVEDVDGCELPLEEEYFFHSMNPRYQERVKGLQTRANALLEKVEASTVEGEAAKARLRSLREGGSDGADGESVVEYAMRMIDVLCDQVDVQVSDEVFMERLREEREERLESKAQAEGVSVGMMLGNVAGMISSDTCVKASLAKGDGFVSFMTSTSEVKPQREFEDAVDNSNVRSVPRCDGLRGVLSQDELLKYRTACEKIVRDEASVLTALPHPLEAAAMALDYRQPAGPDTPPSMPMPMEKTELMLVDTVEDLERLGQMLREGVAELAVDLEAHNYRSFQGFCCLMQMSTRDKDIIVDVLKLRHHVGRCLGPVFADGGIVKVLHGSNGDIGWLQRDFGIYVCNLFDTGVAAKELKYESNGLAHLLEKLCGFKADKRWQLADWRIRPLQSQAIHYARADTHFLLYCYDVLRRELAQQDLGTRVWEESRKISLTVYEKELTMPGSFYELYKRMESKSGSLTERQLSVFAAVYEWRDRLARALDESPGYLLPRGPLLHLARKSPTSKRELDAALKTKNKILIRYSSDLLAVIGKALKDTSLAQKAMRGELALPGVGTVKDGDPSEDRGGPADDEVTMSPISGRKEQQEGSHGMSLYTNLGISIPITKPALPVSQKSSMGNISKAKPKKVQIHDVYAPQPRKLAKTEVAVPQSPAEEPPVEEPAAEPAESPLEDPPLDDTDGHLPFGTMDEEDFLPLPISQLTKKRKPKRPDGGRHLNAAAGKRPGSRGKQNVESAEKGAQPKETAKSLDSFDRQAAIDKYSSVFAAPDTGGGRGRGRGRGRGGRGGQKKGNNNGFIIPEGHFNPMSRLIDGHPKGSSKRSATQVRSGNRSSTYRKR